MMIYDILPRTADFDLVCHQMSAKRKERKEDITDRVYSVPTHSFVLPLSFLQILY